MNLEAAEEIAWTLIARWEGWRPRPYLCPAGVPTIGYGFTYYEDGRYVTLLDAPMSKERAHRLLTHLLRTKYMRIAHILCPGAVTPGQLAAVTDFCYNLGTGNLKNSTLRRRINAGEWDLVPDEFRKWVRAGGKKLNGLVLRREAEIAYL